MTIRAFYEGYDEDGRLARDSLEWLRSRELIGRVLPDPPARIADVAGGTGPYALWLAGLGYEVSLLDLVPAHVARAREKARDAGLTIDCIEGDARALPWADASQDVVLVMGALYHLQERADRVACLREAHRVLRPGGVLAVAYISRFASLMDGYARGFIADSEFASIVAEDLTTGRHENPSERPGWFTTAYFHRPDEIAPELADAGFPDADVLPVEGFVSATDVPHAQRTDDGMALLLSHLRATEHEPSLLGVSAHLMALARKPL